MDLLQTPRSEKRKSFITAIALSMLVMLIAAPIAQAQQRVKVQGVVKVKPQGGRFDSKPIADMGLLQAAGSSGALAVRTFAGGGGFLGAADCTAGTNPAGGDFVENTINVSNAIVTGIIITGTNGRVTVTSAAVGNGQVPLIRFRATAENPNEFVGLGNGLTVTAPLTFTGSAETGNNGECNFVVLGQ